MKNPPEAGIWPLSHMLQQLNLMQSCRNDGGWGRGRGKSLAELGITEEELDEHALHKPLRDRDGRNTKIRAERMQP